MLAEQHYWPLAATETPPVVLPQPRSAPVRHRFASALVIAVVAHVAVVAALIALPLHYATEQPTPPPASVGFTFGGMADDPGSAAITEQIFPAAVVPEPTGLVRQPAVLPETEVRPVTITVSAPALIGVTVVDAQARRAATEIAGAPITGVGGPTGFVPSGSSGATGTAGAGAGSLGVTMPATRPAYLHNPPPRYPQVARQNGWEGVTVLRVEIEATGKPNAVTVKQSSGHTVLDEAAVAAVRDWKFVPARAGHQPTGSWLEIPIRFRLIDA